MTLLPFLIGFGPFFYRYDDVLQFHLAMLQLMLLDECLRGFNASFFTEGNWQLYLQRPHQYYKPSLLSTFVANFVLINLNIIQL